MSLLNEFDEFEKIKKKINFFFLIFSNCLRILEK